MRRHLLGLPGARFVRASPLFMVLAILASCAIILPSNISIVETTSPTAAPPGPGAGFGDRQNSYAWSMAWFNGKLYVGTVRNELCLEGLTSAFFHPNQGYYQTNPGISVTCPADPWDMDLRAQIWQFDPTVSGPSQAWQMVYQSPADIPNPLEPGKFVAEDIGFRGMVVYTDPSDPTGTPTLYVGGVTADEVIPQLQVAHPPRILRTTDGKTFTPVNGGPGQLQYDIGQGTQSFYPMGYRAMMVYNNRLFVTASGDLTGDGPMLEVSNPSGANPTFTQVSPPNLNVYELQTFNGHLYVGAGSYQTGYAVWRTDATGAAPFQYTPIVTGGAGRGVSVTSVVSMYPFQGRLYVGSSGWVNSLFPISELIRVNPDDSWQLVVGNPRQAQINGATTTMSPISGLPDGFGNPFNAHFWRMQDFEGGLYLGTNDWSYSVQLVPGLNTALQPQFGFDIDGTCDGQSWYLITQDAFGDGQFNFGARTMATSSDQTRTFIGSANQAQGLNVWQITNTTPNVPVCSASPTTPATTGAAPTIKAATTAPTTFPTTMALPTHLEADVQSCGTVVSWDPAPGAKQYRILRSQSQPQVVTAPRPVQLPGGGFLDAPPPVQAGGGSVSGTVWVSGPLVQIATTSQTSFVDASAQPGGHYTYVVQAVDANNKASALSNIATTPTLTPAVSFGSLISQIQGLASRGEITPSLAASLVGSLTAAQQAAGMGYASAVAQALNGVSATLSGVSAALAQTPGGASGSLAVQDLQSNLARLVRQLSVLPSACPSGGANSGSSLPGGAAAGILAWLP